MQDILRDAFCRRYGVGAFNVVNVLTLRAVLAAAEAARAPVIIQVSLKTVRHLGSRFLQGVFADLAARVAIPATLHLDHCPDREVIEDCIAAGWNSVLFDASALSYEQNLEQTQEVVRRARRHGVAVEGELETVPGVEDGVGLEAGGGEVTLEQTLRFIRETGVDSFAPAIGTAHGLYSAEPTIHFQRVTDIVAAEPIPLVLHGGTGLRAQVIQDLIQRGAVKVNISTDLKIAYLQGLRGYLTAHPECHDPLALHDAVEQRVQAMVAGHLHTFGCIGRAP